MVALHCINPLDYERGCRIFVVCSWGYRHRATKLAKNSIPKFPISLCATDTVIITVWRAGPCWRGWGGGWPAGARLGTAGPPAHRGHCHTVLYCTVLYCTGSSAITEKGEGLWKTWWWRWWRQNLHNSTHKPTQIGLLSRVIEIAKSVH